jgi:hypothetical protein
MNDPLDVLRRDGGATEPDPAFRARLMQRVSEALESKAIVTFDPHADSNDDLVAANRHEKHPELEIIMDPDTSSRQRRSMVVAAAVGTAAALLVALVLVVRNGDDPVDPAAPGPSASTPVAPASTAALTTIPPTTTALPATTLPPPSDDQIAEAAFLTADEVGDDFGPSRQVDIWTLEGETAAAVPECAAFLDTVFESAARPATVAVEGYSKEGAEFEQYVVVLPTVAGARAMMSAVGDPSFPACWAPFISAIYNKTQQCCTDYSYQPAAAHTLEPVGEEMDNLALSGTISYLGETYVDEGPTPFVRVGRAVMILNPPSLATVVPGTGYPDGQLDRAMAVSVERLRTAQGL